VKVSGVFTRDETFPADGKRKAEKRVQRFHSSPLLGGDETLNPSAFPTVTHETQKHPVSFKLSRVFMEGETFPKGTK
jgi:hypothetical protein